LGAGRTIPLVDRPSQRREMAETAVERRGVSIALACRAFGVSEICYRYNPKLKDKNEVIADLLTGLTDARKTWGFGLCFLHLRNVKGHPWNHKRVYRIYCQLELNLRSEPFSAIDGVRGSRFRHRNVPCWVL
jgi:putative transposase